MKNFKYIQPKSLSEVKKYFSDNHSVLYAGGTDVLGLVKKEVYNYENMIDLKSVPDLDKVEEVKGKGLKIGALVKISEIAESEIIKNKYTALSDAAQKVASPQIRNMATLGGNICQRPRCWYYRDDYACLRKDGDYCYAEEGENKYHAVIGGSPCFIVHPSDTAVALMALDAVFNIFDGNAEREVPISEFFVQPDEDVYLENILKPYEVLTSVFIPEQKNKVSRFIKFAERDVWDFAMASVAVKVEKNGNKITGGKIILGGVAPIPWYDEKINKGISGLTLDEKSIDEFSKLALQDAEPLSKNGYKITLARNLIKMILSEI
ncbi:MAG: xanthine dehydrogenase family protein subunit M [Melioribacteraceae bacterium]|nr:xanthine dehydrogenase family protein subunit M [Melioribacteraceae bacterium]